MLIEKIHDLWLSSEHSDNTAQYTNKPSLSVPTLLYNLTVQNS